MILYEARLWRKRWFHGYFAYKIIDDHADSLRIEWFHGYFAYKIIDDHADSLRIEWFHGYFAYKIIDDHADSLRIEWFHGYFAYKIIDDHADSLRIERFRSMCGILDHRRGASCTMAAKRTGRRHVGLDIDSDYAKFTPERAAAENEAGDACESAHPGKAAPIRDCDVGGLPGSA